jgi:serine/threonine-protein kinase mTOR
MLLHEVGKHHPQALIYPLTVASKSTNKAREVVVKSILSHMRDHSQVIADQVTFRSHIKDIKLMFFPGCSY